MKYNVVQVGSQWAVSAGRQKYFSQTLTDDKAEALDMAHYHSARWHLLQAAKLAKGARITDLKKLAQMGHELVDAYTNRAETEDPDFSPSDPWAFLA